MDKNVYVTLCFFLCSCVMITCDLCTVYMQNDTVAIYLLII